MHNAPDRIGAALGSAGLSFTPVDVKAVLEISKFSIGLAEIPKRRSACRNSVLQHLPDHRNKSRKPHLRDLVDLACGMNACAKQSLADIDITQTGDVFLI